MDTNRRQFLRQGAVGAVALTPVTWLASGKDKPSGSSRQLSAAWVDDPGRRAGVNKAGRNYWYAYMPEILDELGLRAATASPVLLESEKQLRTYSTLLVSDIDVSSEAAGKLEQWVRDGGVLVALGTKGIDRLCGNRSAGRNEQTGGDFSCAATFALAKNTLTDGIHSYLQPDQRLLIFSDVQKVRPSESFELARLFDSDGKDTTCAAITGRELEKGRVYYFGFSVPQTMWVLHQGLPVDRDRDGDGWFRRSDAIVIRPHSTDIAYADEILFVLQSLIGLQPHAFVHQLPPVVAAGGVKIPDALFFYGGDDEGDSKGTQVTASNWMKEKGLPYHVNALPRKDGTFGLSAADAQKLLDNGHELAIHFNFIDNFAPGQGYTREQLLAQADAFQKHFGRGQTCSVMHWLRWTGWAEPAKWMSEAGIKADNGFPAVGSPPSNPVNTIGFSSGTAFPFWFYDDWKGDNAKIEFLEEPTIAYEVGYEGSKTDFSSIHKIVDLAVRYHLTVNMFYHPIYISKFPACRAAIEELQRYIGERKITAAHMGNDELYRWWKARADTKVGSVTAAGPSISVDVETSHPAGVIVKVPLGGRTAKSATANDREAAALKNEHIFGQNWAFIAVPAGKSRVKITTA